MHLVFEDKSMNIFESILSPFYHAWLQRINLSRKSYQTVWGFLREFIFLFFCVNICKIKKYSGHAWLHHYCAVIWTLLIYLQGYLSFWAFKCPDRYQQRADGFTKDVWKLPPSCQKLFTLSLCVASVGFLGGRELSLCLSCCWWKQTHTNSSAVISAFARFQQLQPFRKTPPGIHLWKDIYSEH